MEDKRKVDLQRRVVKLLERNGMTPFDLLSWVWLLDFNERSKEFNGIDLNIHIDMRKDIVLALVRKAKALDAHDGTTSHMELLSADSMKAVLREAGKYQEGPDKEQNSLDTRPLDP